LIFDKEAKTIQWEKKGGEAFSNKLKEKNHMVIAFEA
jgi:hypothetical protein